MRTRASITSGRAPRHAPRAVAPRGGGDETGVRAGQQSLPRSCRRHRRPAHFDQAPTTRFTPPHSPPPRAPASPPRTRCCCHPRLGVGVFTKAFALVTSSRPQPHINEPEAQRRKILVAMMLARSAFRAARGAHGVGAAAARRRTDLDRRFLATGLSAPINGYEESKRPKLFIPGARPRARARASRAAACAANATQRRRLRTRHCIARIACMCVGAGGGAGGARGPASAPANARPQDARLRDRPHRNVARSAGGVGRRHALLYGHYAHGGFWQVPRAHAQDVSDKDRFAPQFVLVPVLCLCTRAAGRSGEEQSRRTSTRMELRCDSAGVMCGGLNRAAVHHFRLWRHGLGCCLLQSHEKGAPPHALPSCAHPAALFARNSLCIQRSDPRPTARDSLKLLPAAPDSPCLMPPAAPQGDKVLQVNSGFFSTRYMCCVCVGEGSPLARVCARVGVDVLHMIACLR